MKRLAVLLALAAAGARPRAQAEALAKALAMGPDVQRGKLPVRPVINRHADGPYQFYFYEHKVF